MDYLDPKKQQQHRIILFVGYIFVAVAIVFATLVLLYQAYGFGLKNGAVIQSGLVFVSSRPRPADIRFNGVVHKSKTNTRMLMPAGIYNLQLNRDGYRTWQRDIEVDGGSVEHFDYPVLFPTKLTTTNVETLAAATGFSTQSPDRRWLLLQQPGSATAFQLFDLKNPTKTPTTITIPTGVLTAATSQSWQTSQWADDNRHVLLQRKHDGATEYILLDREQPAETLNLNTALAANPSKLTLRDRKYDLYSLLATDGTLSFAGLKAPALVTAAARVLAYETYGTDQLLFVTDADAPTGKTLLKLKDGDQTYVLHTFPAGTNYIVDLTEYGGTLYTVAGASSENKAYIYRDPIGQLRSQPNHAVVPTQVLHVLTPDYVSFSTSAQLIVVEHGTQFGVYDLENKSGYSFTVPYALDAPQTHASWMDSSRLTYVSSGTLLVLDYDSNNQQLLMPASPAYVPAFTPDYKYVFSLISGTAGQQLLTQTALVTKDDL